MNILMLTESFPPHAGGSGWSTYYLARALKKRGHNVAVAKIRGADDSYNEFLIHNLRSRKDLLGLVGSFHPDIIHAQHRLSAVWGAGLGVPSVVTIRDYWHISYDGTCFDERSQKNYGRETLGTIIRSLNKRGFLKYLSPFAAVYLFFRTVYSRSILKKYEVLVCNSSFTYAVTKKALPRARCVVIHNLIDFEKLSAVQPERFGVKVVLYVGKLSKNKGPQVLIDAAVKVKPKVKYIFIGEGALQQYISAKAKENKVDAEFFGYLPNDRVLSMMKGADALVLPALWNEPLGRTHLEGIGVGAKIITTDTGGTKDIIEDYYNGLFFDKTPAGLAEKIGLLLSDRKLAVNLSRNAQESAKAKFDEKVVVEKFEKLYLGLIKK